MIYKLVSTLILTGQVEDCKCEIYHVDKEEGAKFIAIIYARRLVLMRLREMGASMGFDDTPTSKPVTTWIEVRILNDINDTTLEEAEASLKRRHRNEGSFIPAFFDSPSL